MDIDKLEGRELDAAVAVRVMGWTAWKFVVRGDRWFWRFIPPGDERVPWYYDRTEWVPGIGIYDNELEPPHYSRDIAAAWEVVERVARMGYYIEVGRDWNELSSCSIHRDDLYGTLIVERIYPLAPEAISKAVLKLFEKVPLYLPAKTD